MLRRGLRPLLSASGRALQQRQPRASVTALARRLSTDAATDKPEEKAAPTEAATGASSKMEFQAETKKLLDIVAKSLYTDKEVFVREIVSNASDALEKRRHAALTADGPADDQSEMAIKISTDSDANTLTIQDSGIGMSREDLVQNLGTIARSGSRSFLQQLQEQGSTAASSANVIGQFGVGFYSVFMVADEVTVYTRRQGEETAHCWTSTGDGSFEISEASGVLPGTKIVLKLKEDETSFSRRFSIEQNIRKYSNFVGFPIYVDGDRVNTVEALWTKSKNEVSADEHKEFYQYVAQSFDEPRYNLHFSTDAPIAINAIFYVPQTHVEKWGMARQDAGVHLYSRKVLIQSRCEALLPEWMRFLKGVVDSEDLPLNISRESMQDSALMRKLSSVLSRRVVKFLQEQAKREPESYLDFFKEFGQFIKEGVYTDFANKDEAAKLLRFESSRGKAGDLISLDDYVSRMAPEQQDQIFYLLAPTRDSALSSAYMEALNAKDMEVLLLYSTVDEFVMTNLMNYGGKSLISAEQAKLKVADDAASGADSLGGAEAEGLRAWLVEAVPGVREVELSSRLVDSPAIVVGHESASMRRVMSMVEAGETPPLPPQKLEINAKHPIIRQLATLRETNGELAAVVAKQMFSNALISAGLLDDPRSMLGELNVILEAATKPAPAA